MSVPRVTVCAQRSGAMIYGKVELKVSRWSRHVRILHGIWSSEGDVFTEARQYC
jgi:hypothetical protein